MEKKKRRLKGVPIVRERAIGNAAKRGGEVLTTKGYTTIRQTSTLPSLWLRGRRVALAMS